MVSTVARWLAVLRIPLAAATVLLLVPSQAEATPGFARQTGLACEACHTVFPELTPFGRQFKLNAYVFSNVKQLQAITPENQRTLALSEFPPVSVQLQASNTTLGKSLPDGTAINGADRSQKNDTQFPQALSIFYTGKISDNLGAFLQVTWAPNTNSVGIDNSDLRFADHAAVYQNDFIYGLTLNNNPTSQDVWNSTPAWGYPFIVSNVAVPPNAKTLIDGTLAQQAAGLGAYVYLWNQLYFELSGYRSAKTNFTNSNTGAPGPLDSTASGANISGVAPYWRVAWEQDWERNSFTVGTFGIWAPTHPAAPLNTTTMLSGVGFHGPTDTFTDVAVDAQYQWIGEDHIVSAYATWIHEFQELVATAGSVGAPVHNHLDTVRLTGSYFFRRKVGGSLQFFSTTGNRNPIFNTTTPVTGSAASKPDTQGAILELDYLPWLNTKLGVQYTIFRKFNGGTNSYDGSGRNASDNNVLFAYIWTAF